jgi:hypothetical protein
MRPELVSNLPELPLDAVSVYTRGDKLFVRFEGHEVDIPVDEPRRLITVLKARESKGRRSTIAEAGAPCQLQIYDAFLEAQSKERKENLTAKKEEKRKKEVEASFKRYEKERWLAEMDEVMEAAGL